MKNRRKTVILKNERNKDREIIVVNDLITELDDKIHVIINN